MSWEIASKQRPQVSQGEGYGQHGEIRFRRSPWCCLRQRQHHQEEPDRKGILQRYIYVVKSIN